MLLLKAVKWGAVFVPVSAQRFDGTAVYRTPAPLEEMNDVAIQSVPAEKTGTIPGTGTIQPAPPTAPPFCGTADAF